jgi:hypothetical protein
MKTVAVAATGATETGADVLDTAEDADVLAGALAAVGNPVELSVPPHAVSTTQSAPATSTFVPRLNRLPNIA